MSTVEKSIRLYAWKTNYQTFRVVQGEDDSRRFNIQLFSTTLPVDLTNCSVKFFAVKPDQTKVYVNCDVIDADDGLVSLVLDEQMCAVEGTVDCWVQVIGDGGTDLRFEGLSLEVSACDLEGAIQGTESADDMKAFLQESAKLAAVETEVKNARVGADGTVYPSAGEAVRRQVGALEEDLSQLSEENDALKTEIEALMVNAKSYGIKGDGETDDSILLNDLVSKLNTEGGGVIYLPDGKYRLNSRITWKSNVSLVGESHNAVLMPYCDNSVSQGFAAISWLNTDGTQQAEYNSSNPMVNCHFRNFTIDGINQNPANYDSYPKGINMHFLKDCTFENIQFLNIYATGLGVDFLEDVFIHNIYCYNCGRGYVVTTDEKIAGGAGIGIGTMGMSKESCIISDCITDRCGNYGIFLEGGAIFPENGCKSHYTIANCQCINGRNYGIAVKGTDNVIVANNIMRNNARDGFALLPRPHRCCKSIEVSNNLSKSNGGCGFRFVDGDYTDNISSELYVVGNVSEKNTKDGILISSVITKAFFNNNSIIENARGIAIADNDYFDVYFSGNMILNCTQTAVVNGLFKNTNLLTNQLVKLISVHDMDYINGYVDDSGTEIEHSSSKTTKSFTYCKGSQYCGFYFDLEYTQMGSNNRICYCHWYDEDMNFISRYGETVNGRGWKRFTPPEGACYVKYRIGINTGELQNSQLKGVYLMRYMTDRCETN